MNTDTHGPACGHGRVEYVAIEIAVGVYQDCWRCRDCKHPFTPVLRPFGDATAEIQWQQQAADLMALKPDWDGYGSLPISSTAIEAALRVLHSVGKLVPCSSGGVQIDWPNAEVEFLPNGEQVFDEPIPGITLSAFQRILGPEIQAERNRQDKQWGGPAHDDGHDRRDWLSFIERFIGLADRPGNAAAAEIFESQMVKIAALAIAAIQSSRRKRNA